jgi:hypothetical protein
VKAPEVRRMIRIMVRIAAATIVVIVGDASS